MKSREGFTILETAMVLMIAGLLIAGVFSAWTLQRSSQLQNMMKEYDTYVKAISEFQTKYNALPGDMGVAAGYDPATMWGDTNGDGNSAIGTSDTDGTVTSANAGNTSSEWFQAWKHLADAKLISGAYTGTGTTAAIGVNVPASGVKGAGWTLLYFLFPSNGSGENSNLLWRDNYGHILALGSVKNHAYTDGAVLTSAEASAIDTKLDDGRPGTGKIRAWRTGTLPNCTINDNTSQSTPTYTTGSSNTLACSLVFILGF